jgi:hypothetical protein
MTATATVAELGDRIKQEGEKQLQKLDVLAHPKRARSAAKKRRRVGMLGFLVLFGGVAYGVYKFFRYEPAIDDLNLGDRDMPARDVPAARETVRSA